MQNNLQLVQSLERKMKYLRQICVACGVGKLQTSTVVNQNVNLLVEQMWWRSDDTISTVTSLR